jgi:type IV pilus assembly protein PilV
MSIEKPANRPALKTLAVQTGFTLIEVLVAVVILSMGLLGLAGLQASSIKNNQVALYRAIASQQANDMADRMRANQCGVVAGNYDNLTSAIPADPACFTTGAGCTPLQMATTDQRQWLLENAAVLPGGSGIVRCCTQGSVMNGNCDNCVNAKAATASCAASTNRVFEVVVTWTEKCEVGSLNCGAQSGTIQQSFVTRFAP